MLNTRTLALASAAAALAATTVVAIARGRLGVATPAAAAELARAGVLFALPGIAVALVARRLPPPRRLFAALGGAALVAAGVALWWADGGLLMAPAAALLVAGAAVHARPISQGQWLRDMRDGPVLDLAAAAAAVLGALGRAVTSGDVAGFADTLSVAASGLVLVGWPFVASTVVPPAARRIAMGVAAALVVVLVWRQPVGDELWFVPAAVLGLLSAAGVRARDPMVLEATVPPSSSPDAPSRTLVTLAAWIGGLTIAGLAAAGPLGRDGVAAVDLLVDGAAAVIPALAAVRQMNRPDRTWRNLTIAAAAVSLVVLAAGASSRPSAAGLAVVPVLVLLASRPTTGALASLPWLPGAAAGVAALLAIGLATVPAHPSGRDMGDAINAAEARFLADVVESAELLPGARCYYIADDDNFVACGPTFHRLPAGEEPSGPSGEARGDGAWDIYAVAAESGRVRVERRAATGQEVDPDLLHRPDGLRPPPDAGRDELRLPTVEADFSTLTSTAPDDARPARGFVLAGTGKVGIEGVASPSTVIDTDGNERRAPSGYRLVAAKLAFDDVEATTLEVLSAGSGLDVTGTVTDGGDSYSDGWLVTVARDDGVDPLLQVTHRGYSQRLSLASGERLGGDPLLYDPPAQTLDRPVPSAEIPVMIPVPAPHQAEVDVGEYTLRTATLTTYDRSEGWAPLGYAWLVVRVESLDEPFLFDIELGDLDPAFRFSPLASFGLGLADASQVSPMAVQAGDSGTDMTVVFLVNEHTRTATLRCAPQWTLTIGGSTLAVTAPPQEVALSMA